MRFPTINCVCSKVRRSPIRYLTERMQVKTNIHRERLAYDYPYADALTDEEEALYWSATREAEDAIARIAKIQERRKDSDGEIRSVLLSDEFHQLNKAIDQLDQSTTVLHLIEKAAEWTDQRDQNRESITATLLEKME